MQQLAELIFDSVTFPADQIAAEMQKLRFPKYTLAEAKQHLVEEYSCSIALAAIEFIKRRNLPIDCAALDAELSKITTCARPRAHQREVVSPDNRVYRAGGVICTWRSCADDPLATAHAFVRAVFDAVDAARIDAATAREFMQVILYAVYSASKPWFLYIITVYPITRLYIGADFASAVTAYGIYGGVFVDEILWLANSTMLCMHA